MTTKDRLNKLNERIEKLERRRKELLAGGNAAARKARTRALIVVGGVVTGLAAANGGDKMAAWLRGHTSKLKNRDREILFQAFPNIFSPQVESAEQESSDKMEVTNA